jgi:hypothetical protein
MSTPYHFLSHHMHEVPEKLTNISLPRVGSVTWKTTHATIELQFQQHNTTQYNTIHLSNYEW